MSLNVHGFQNRSYTDEEELNSGEHSVPPKTTPNGKDNHTQTPGIVVPEIKIELDQGPGHVTFTPDTNTNGHLGQNGNNINGHVGHYGDDR